MFRIRKRTLKFLCVAAFWVALAAITVFALLPAENLPSLGIDLGDKAKHVVAYYGLTCLGLFAYPVGRKQVILGLLGHGALIELAQAVSGWRSCDWTDWIADCIGIGAAYITLPNLGRRPPLAPAGSK